MTGGRSRSYKAEVQAACVHHPEREAVGVCVLCRRSVCTECTTKLDGINHCSDCVATLAASVRVAPRAERAEGAAHASLATVLWCAFLVLVVWGLLELALPGSA